MENSAKVQIEVGVGADVVARGLTAGNLRKGKGHDPEIIHGEEFVVSWEALLEKR